MASPANSGTFLPVSYDPFVNLVDPFGQTVLGPTSVRRSLSVSIHNAERTAREGNQAYTKGIKGHHSVQEEF